MLQTSFFNTIHKASQNFVSAVYKKMYNEEMSVDVKHFITNIRYVGIGITISTFFSFLFNILSGRIFGPSEYGKFALIQSTAMFLLIPMSFGIPTAMVKYGSEKEDLDRQKTVISTSYILIIICVLFFTVVYDIYSKQIAEKFSIPEDSFRLAIFFACFFIFSLMTTNTLRSVNELKKYSMIKSTYGLLQLVPLILFIYFSYISYTSIIYSIFISNIIVGLLTLRIIKKYIGFKFELTWAKILIYFSLYTAISDLSYIVYSNIDQLLINKYMLVENVGIYNAYFYSSINVVNIFAGILSTVFLPTISKYNDKTPIFKRLNKLIPYIIVLGIPFIVITEYIILNIYGKGYPFNITLAFLFGTTSVMSVWYALYASILTSIGIKGAKINLIGTVTIAIVNILLDVCLIPILGLNGAMIATTSGYCCGIGILWLCRNLLK
jgi:O-antigen/teichoic acid export membrane protein